MKNGTVTPWMHDGKKEAKKRHEKKREETNINKVRERVKKERKL